MCGVTVRVMCYGLLFTQTPLRWSQRTRRGSSCSRSTTTTCLRWRTPATRTSLPDPAGSPRRPSPCPRRCPCPPPPASLSAVTRRGWTSWRYCQPSCLQTLNELLWKDSGVCVMCVFTTKRLQWHLKNDSNPYQLINGNISFTKCQSPHLFNLVLAREPLKHREQFSHNKYH